MDNSLFLIVISLILIWLVVDNIVGKKYIDAFILTMFPELKGG